MDTSGLDFVPISGTDTSGGTDWSSLVLLGNDIALQWYALTHDRPVPQPQYLPGTNIPTQYAYDSTKLVVIGLVAVAAIILLRK